MSSTSAHSTAAVATTNKGLKKVASTLAGRHQYRARLYRLLSTYSTASGKVQLTTVFETQALKKLEQKDRLGAQLFGYLTELTRRSNLSPLQALNALLPSDEVAIIEAHPTENLEQGFKRAAFLANKKNDIHAAFTSSLLMPIMSLVIGFTTAFYLLSNQVPIYTSALPDISYWPEIARPLLTLHAIFVTYLPFTAGAITGFVLWVRLYSLKAPPGGHRSFFDKLPPWSIQKQMQSSVFLTSLGTMLQQQKTLRESLLSLARVSPTYLAAYQRQMLTKIEANLPVSKIIASDIFDVETRNFLSDFVEKDSLPDLMQDLGKEQLNEMASRIVNLSTIVGTLFIMLSAILNMYIVFSGFALNDAMVTYYR